MSRKISHQAEVENRHTNNGSWSSDGQYRDYGYSDSAFSHYFHIYIENKTNKVIIPGTKSKAVKILTTQWGLSFTEALQITVSIFKQIDVLDEHLQKTIYCYMIMKKISPETLTANITKLKLVLRGDHPDAFLSKVINKYQNLMGSDCY